MGKFKLLSCAFGVSFLLAGTALAQTDPNAHGPFDTNSGSPAAPQGTPSAPFYVTPTGGGSAGGSNGSVTAAGTGGTVAQAVQGISGGVAVQTSPTAPSAVAANGASTAVTSVAAGTLVAKTGASLLYSVSATPTVAGYLMVFNSSAVPADGTVTPFDVINCPANVTTTISFAYMPQFLPLGISIAFSTTGAFTKTVSATAFINATYK